MRMKRAMVGMVALGMLLGIALHAQDAEPVKPMPADASPGFDVVTIKPSDPERRGTGFGFRGRHFFTVNTTGNDLIKFAYRLQSKQIVNGPAWLGSDKFDVDGVPDVEGRPDPKQMGILLQKLLADRFHLQFHREERELSVYVLTVSKNGPKLTQTASKPTDPPWFTFQRRAELTVKNSTMKGFCDGMEATVMDRPVVDHTGLTERYDFTLNWTPDDPPAGANGKNAPPPVDEANAPPGLYTAIQEQLGLKFEPTKAPASVLVIDEVEKPSAN
jgi:uncharacterized protein (TIGR03435 family)